MWDADCSVLCCLPAPEPRGPTGAGARFTFGGRAVSPPAAETAPHANMSRLKKWEFCGAC